MPYGQILANFAPKMKQLLAFILLILSFPAYAQAQTDDTDANTDRDPAIPMFVQVGKVPYHGDSIPNVVYPPLYKYPPLEFKNEKERARFNRLVANVKKVLPIAKLAKYTIIETYTYMETLPDKESRDRHARAMEAGLRRQYEPMVRKLTFSQGKLLVKLIDRECNQTSFSIVKAFIGSLRANMWQVVADIFGNSLKKRYDPEGDDRYTERVVRMVESGQL